jgi:BolA protein
MRVADLITRKLTEAFAPESIRVVDESHQHVGHAGHRPGGESHFRLYIVSEAFRGKSRLERHRMVNAALAAELAGDLHALAIHAAAPGEGRG